MHLQTGTFCSLLVSSLQRAAAIQQMLPDADLLAQTNSLLYCRRHMQAHTPVGGFDQLRLELAG